MDEAKGAAKGRPTAARRGAFAGGRLERLSPSGEASRATLLRAASETFAEKGFADASMEDVARRCGATKGLVYHHYRSKGDLHIDAVRWGLAYLDAAVLPAFTLRERAATRLKAMAEAHIAALLSEPAARHARGGRWPAALVRQQPEETEAVERLAAAYEERFLALLEDARREGDAEGRPAAPLAAATLLAILDMPARAPVSTEPRDIALAALRAAGIDPGVLAEEFS